MNFTTTGVLPNPNDTNEQTELRKALESAQTVQETLKAFKAMECCFQESELGPTCFVVAQKLFSMGHSDIQQWADTCMILGQKKLALRKAKDVLDLGRFAHALVIQVQVAKGVEGLPASEQEFVQEVSRQLSLMKQRVAESSTSASSQLSDGGLPAKIFKMS